MSLTYEGVGQNHKWARQETYSGRLVENATQAIARDILAEAMARMEGYGLNIVGHVHDEVIIEAPKDRSTVDEVKVLLKCYRGEATTSEEFLRKMDAEK